MIVFQSVICRTSEAHGQNFKAVLEDQENKVYYISYCSVNVKLLKGMHTYTEKHLGFRNGKTCSAAMVWLDLVCD